MSDNELFKISTSFQDIENRDNIDNYTELYLEMQDRLENEIVMKGNVLLNLILPNYARSTKDLDVEVVDERMCNKVILPFLIRFANYCIDRGLATEYSIRESKDSHNGGIKIRKGNSIVYSIDVAVRLDLESNSYTNYKFENVSINGSSIEKILSDKLSSVLSNFKFRRAKDFYDIYIIQISKTQYTIEKVRDIFASDNGYNKSLELLGNFPYSEEDLKKLEHAWSKMVLRDRKGNLIEDVPTLRNTISEVGRLVGYIRRGIECIQR